MDEFKKYTEEKLKLEENKTDQHYIHIGENAYTKNYIGFQSIEDIETFMNFDFKIYKKIFPSKSVHICSIILLIIDIIFIYGHLFISSFYMKLEDKIKHFEDKTIESNHNIIESNSETEINHELNKEKINQTEKNNSKGTNKEEEKKVEEEEEDKDKKNSKI